ncbi:MAG: hypothetical protein ACPG7F_22565 [Aggregatilineales bacterium]
MPAIIFQQQVSLEDQQFLKAILASHTTLEKVLMWLTQQNPPLQIIEMLQQDEFTSDILIKYKPDITLSYDCT